MLNKDRSFQELLPWMFPVSPSVVACKDSGFLACYEFQGVDGDASTVTYLNALTNRLDSAMRFLQGRPASVWWTVRRVRTDAYPGGNFQDPVSAMLDHENRVRFESGDNYINRHYVSILIQPERGADQFFDRVKRYVSKGESLAKALTLSAKSIFSSSFEFAYQANELGVVLAEMEDLFSSVTSTISDIGIRRLSGPDLIGFLRAMAHPGASHVNSHVDPEKWFLDSALPEAPISVGEKLIQFDDAEPRYVSAVTMKSWPSATWVGMFDRLLSMPGEMVLSHAFRVMGTEATRKHIEGVKSFNDLMKYPLKSWIVGAFASGGMNESAADPARQRASEEAQEAVGLLSDGTTFWGWHNMTLLLIGQTPTEADELAKLSVSALQNAGLTGVMRETIGTLSAYAATMPGQWYQCERWATLSMQNVSDMAPLRSVLRGEETNDYLTKQTGRYSPALTVLSTEYRTPFYFNFHSDALAHTLVIGPSRSGKSVGMNFLLGQWQKYAPCRTIIFDKDFSCKIATLLQGGEHINLAADGNMKLNPLLLVSDKEHWPFLAQWIERLICSRGYVLTAKDERSIYEALEEIYNDPTPAHRRLSTVYTLLPSHLKEQLDPWVGDKPLARYFDNEEDSFSISNFCCIEMGQIMRQPRIARAFVDYAFYRIQKQLEENRTGRVLPTVIYLEECWFLLEDEAFADRIRDWLKTLAKLTAHVVMATQSLEDIVGSETKVFASIRDNMPTRIFLPNDAAMTESLFHLYKTQFELTPDQIKKISEARPKENYFIVKPGVARMVSCKFNARQLAVLRSDAVAQGVFERHYTSGNPNWKSNYIEELAHA